MKEEENFGTGDFMIYETDVVVIGAGPVGLFAIFQCGMLGLKCHVIDTLSEVGGQCAALYPEKPIYDIPAYPRVLGAELIQNLEAQAAPFNPTYHLNQQVTHLAKLGENEWCVKTSAQTEIKAKAILIAAGVGAFGPNRPPLENLEEYEAKSVFYFVKNKEIFRGKKIVIAGGGDSAVDWALALCEVADHVSVVHRRDKFRAAPESVARLKDLARVGKLDLVVPYQLSALQGENGLLREVTVEDLDKNTRSIQAEALLSFFGLSMDLGPIAEWGLEMGKYHHIKVNPETSQTNIEGVFAIGDVATYPGKLKLILVGFAEAACAAHAIRALLHPDEVFHFEYSTTQGIPEK